MKRCLLTLFIFISASFRGVPQDFAAPEAKNCLNFSGQFSAWGLGNPANDLPVYLGARYLPLFNYPIKLRHSRKIDFELSANILGSSGIHPFDRTNENGSIRLYRAWIRYSTRQFELRAGLQKISFGSATLLRPLMWFDQIDPRDPLQLTDGVWGVLGRYYFLNNANLWLWCLYGNDKQRPWDPDRTNGRYPESGGRFQSPVPRGEIGLSFHHRTADTQGLGAEIPAYSAVAENRIGLDAKWDLGVGLWVEGTYVNKSSNAGKFTNTEILNIGADNTFSVGNGVNLAVEQILFAYDQCAFGFSQPITFSGLSLSYPLSVIDNLSLISFFDWNHKTAYNFVNLKRKFNKISLYFMAFWNPVTYLLPQQLNSGNYYSGKGIQLMVVYNH